MNISSNHNLIGILYCLIVLQFWLIAAKSVNIDNCYNSTRDFYPYLASRTPYKFVHGNIQRVEGCTPLQIWMTARHGTRYPDRITKQQILDLENFRDEIVSNHEYGRGQLCSKDIKKLRLWRRDTNFYEDKVGGLGEAGEEELNLLAQRLKSTFPELLGSRDPNDYNFVASKRNSATSSLMSFAKSLLDTNATIDYKNDELKESADCPRWGKEYNHSELMTEHRKFANGSVMRQTLSEISQRLGFAETVGFDIVNVMYDVCRFETALAAGNISVWCTGFSKEDLIVFEYINDLDYYYCCGPGNELSKKLSCGVLQKLFEAFELLESPIIKNQPKGIFNFGHSTNIQSVLSLLKVFDGEGPLLASKYESSKNRLFRTTFMNAFGSNIVAVFYRCDNMIMPNQVQFHVAEKPIEIPGCEGQLCDWNYLKRKFQPTLDQCDPNYCDLPQNETITSFSSNSAASHIRNLVPLILISFSCYNYI